MWQGRVWLQSCSCPNWHAPLCGWGPVEDEEENEEDERNQWFIQRTLTSFCQIFRLFLIPSPTWKNIRQMNPNEVLAWSRVIVINNPCKVLCATGMLRVQRPPSQPTLMLLPPSNVRNFRISLNRRSCSEPPVLQHMPRFVIADLQAWRWMHAYYFRLENCMVLNSVMWFIECFFIMLLPLDHSFNMQHYVFWSLENWGDVSKKDLHQKKIRIIKRKLYLHQTNIPRDPSPHLQGICCILKNLIWLSIIKKIDLHQTFICIVFVAFWRIWLGIKPKICFHCFLMVLIAS